MAFTLLSTLEFVCSDQKAVVCIMYVKSLVLLGWAPS